MKRKKSVSIRRIILLVFIVTLLLSVSFHGTVVFLNWIASARNLTAHMASEINNEIYHRVNTFMQVPYQVNESNHRVIENKMLNLSDEKQMDQFFVEVLGMHGSEIYSISYLTAKGEYLGAYRNENGVIDVIRNNDVTDENIRYYAFDEGLTVGDLLAGQLDPRIFVWYKAAEEAGGPTFSPIYKHSIMEDLTVSAACPIYNQYGTLEGVLGVHMLLSDIGSYLKDAVEEHSGIAFIIEKESNHLIANSIGADNYTMLQNGTLKRNGLDDIDNSDIQKAYIQYKENDDSTQFYKGKNDNFFVNTKELHMAGIDWIVISAIPESIFMTDIYFSMYWTGLIVALSLLMTVLIYNFFMTKYLKPLKSLLQATSEFAAGDLSRRFEIVRNDEIGLIAKSVNSMSDTMQLLIENLEATVQKRTQELNNAKDALQARKDELRLILDTAAEAIYGIDVNGNCTFCNKSCVTMLGYSHQSELLGKNMHRQIHHSRRDGTPIAIEDCTIFKAFQKGEGTHVEHEVFWRADGTPFDVEYFSYPQKKTAK